MYTNGSVYTLANGYITTNDELTIKISEVHVHVHVLYYMYTNGSVYTL